MRKRITSIIIGILALALGIVLVGNIAGFWDFELFFDGWWTVVVMAIALISIVSDKPNIFNVYFLLFGGAMLLRACGVIKKDVNGWLIAVALLVIAVGIKMIISAIFKSSNVSTGYTDAGKAYCPNECSTTFSEQKLNFSGMEFTNANYEVAFGKLTIDLRGATFAENAFMSIEAAFGSAVILVSQDTQVKVSREAVFGSVKNDAEATAEKALNVKAEAVFGSVEIRRG